ncbi:MAG: hypothetical protein WAW85_13405 [Gordonia sp. (in: high G+C Gram-positive bacteria)]|uniref:hypothetical protein n=1 Tax=Gordonia sp. (in: high G+C Gram-positive bacteria) TaxID=84139 RepID=UPI003BB5B190
MGSPADGFGFGFDDDFGDDSADGETAGDPVTVTTSVAVGTDDGPLEQPTSPAPTIIPASIALPARSKARPDKILHS